MRRDQEGRQRQGLRTIFKPLKEWYGKTDESQWTTIKEALKGRPLSSDEEVIGATQNCLKRQPKTFFSDGILKQKL
jgi:hypothetical protein